ncbi:MULTISPECIES: ATP-binding cassette domain-containing protein [Actinoalloteichus]|uniref:ATP-binding cassette domain-containing protein n=1 Tax=Actinoalloteichus TaxID=65496 RepID=UPI001E64EA88|nr:MULTISPECIES: ATP-binding cassette domain-containing protein [Actinoalloteichus]
MAVILGWSLVEGVPALLSGALVGLALDRGFGIGLPWIGTAWLLLLAGVCVIGAIGSRLVFARLGDVVEPLRDNLVTEVVRGVLHAAPGGASTGDAGAVARITRHVEVVRDVVAGLLVQARGLVVTTVASVVGLAVVAGPLIWLVLPPVVCALLLFALLLRPLARRQRDLVLADEGTAATAGTVFAGMRDVVACGASDTAITQVASGVEAQRRAAVRLGTAGALRVLIVGLGGLVPLLLVLAAAPGLVAEQRLSQGAVLAAMVYLTTGVQPTLIALAQTAGTAVLRLVTTLRRLAEGAAAPEDPGETATISSAAADPSRSTGESSGPRTEPDSGTAVVVREPAAGDAARPAASRAAGRPASPTGSTGSAGSTGSPQAAAEQAESDLPGAPTPAAERLPTASVARDASISGARCDGAPLLRVRGVTFGWGAAARPVVRDLSVELGPGDHLAVIGPSGIGKSTLAGLLTGGLRPACGTVTLGGVPVAAMRPAARGREIVLIPQETYLFAGTVRENLALLTPTADDGTLLAAAEAVGAAGLIRELGGLDSDIGHGGGALSAGQAQLIALSRAYATDAPVVVLDEATAHLDPRAEARAETAFAHRGGILVVIAHRLSSAVRARRVLLMDGARVHSGSHRELIESSRLYADLMRAWSVPAGAAAPGAAESPGEPGPGSAG